MNGASACAAGLLLLLFAAGVVAIALGWDGSLSSF